MWALVPLAIGAMTQETGRVFNTDGTYASWLRFSPIICAGDMLAFLVSLLYDYIVDPTLSLKHLRAELAWRFRDYDLANLSTGDLKKSTVIRWALMIVGGIPLQTVKLFAMQGIPCTKAFALMYFIPQVLSEVLYFTAVMFFSKRGAPYLRALYIPSKESSLPLDLWEDICHWCQVALFAVVVLRLEWRPTATQVSTISDFMKYSVPIAFILVFIYSVYKALRILEKLPIQQSLTVEHYLNVLVATFQLCCLLYPLSLVHINRMHWLWLMPIGFFFLMMWIVGGVTEVVRAVTMGFRNISDSRVGRALGIPSKQPLGDLCGVITLNFIAFVLGYCFLFDGTGTVNPSWVGIFG